jgi:sulfur relay (sulfurtransferase) complex TusBCD TusD component (DsrE family)
MIVAGRKLGILVSADPSQPNFTHAIRLAEAARAEGVDVYLYCLDEALPAITSANVQNLRASGAKIFGCAFGAQKRSLQIGEEAVLAGLGMVSEIMSSTDRFVAFS